MGEQPKQLIEQVRLPVPARPGAAAKEDFEYVRQGMCVAWMFVEPLAGWRAASVALRKTAMDWAHQLREVVEAPRYAQAERITLVCDNLNVHRLASLYEAFAPAEALRLARKLELVHTPRHGSWLNMAEPELSCVDEAMPGPAHWPNGAGEQACPAMGRRAQPAASGNRLAMPYRQCTDQAQLPLSEN